MKSFEVGDVVRIIDGPRKGEETTVSSKAFPAPVTLTHAGFSVVAGTLIHHLALEALAPGTTVVVAPGEWLERLENLAELEASP